MLENHNLKKNRPLDHYTPKKKKEEEEEEEEEEHKTRTNKN